MANLNVSWTAECETCMEKLGEEHMDDKCPDSYDFDTARCMVCDEEVCKSCGNVAEEKHNDCKDDEEE